MDVDLGNPLEGKTNLSMIYCRLISEGLDGGSGIPYSLKISPLFISLKFWVIH